MFYIKNGIDIIFIDRIENLINKYCDTFLQKILTEEEIKMCTSSKGVDAYKVAKKFSAKEAFAKACGLGIGRVTFQGIEIKNNNLGEPFIKLSNKANETVKNFLNCKDYSISLSISDDKNIAITSVVLLVNTR